MQRSHSSSAANLQPPLNLFIPIRPSLNKRHEHYSSDSDTQHQTYLQRTSSTSSFSSSSSRSSANYRILPVRYSSVDRVQSKPAIVTANEHGINVRIRFDRPHCHHHHHHHHHDRHRREHTEEYEHYRKRHLSKDEDHYNSCPTLTKNIIATNYPRPSNIHYIATRSIIRGYSYEQLNQPSSHSTTLIIRRPSLQIRPPQIRHISLDTHAMFKPVSTRVIEEKKECLLFIVVIQQEIFNMFRFCF